MTDVGLMYKTLLVFTIIFTLLLSVLVDNNNFQIYFLDVGQGDAILVRTSEGQNILIDGGPDNKLLAELGNYLPWWERNIDYLIITHYHADHMMGFIELLDKYKVKNVLVTAHQPDDFLYRIWADKLAEKSIVPQIVQVGEKFVADDNLFWQIILADSWHEDYNENSLVIKLVYQDKIFLLMGDLGMEGEDRILASGLDIDADYLKVGHHGSKYSSSEDFLQAVSPQMCIIQSGLDNKFGHPHQEALDRLEKSGCQILDTKDLGTIRLSF